MGAHLKVCASIYETGNVHKVLLTRGTVGTVIY